MTTTIIIFFIYMLLMIGVGIWAYLRSSRTLDGFLVADRSLGPWVTAFSTVHTGATGWVFTGWVLAGYSLGISALWYALTLPLFALLSFKFIAPKLRIESGTLGSPLIEDFIAQKLGDPYHLIKIISTIFIFGFLLTYVGSQAIIGGITLEAAFKWDYKLCVIMIVVFGAFYTYIGGMRAEAYTDLIQGFIVVGACILVPILMIVQIGGWDKFVTAVTAAKPTLLTASGGRTGGYLLMFVLGYFGIGLGYLGFPPMVSRFLAIKDTRSIGPAMVIAVVSETIRMFCPVFIGLAARVIYPVIKNPEQAYSMYISQYLPPILAGIFIAAILAAIMSSMDSWILLMTGSVANNIYRRIINPQVSQKTLLNVARVVVVISALAGLVIGIYRVKTLLYFMMFVFGALGSSFGPTLLFTLHWKKTTSWGALAGLVAGIFGTFAWMLWSPYYPDVREAFVAFPLAIVCIVVVSLLTQKKKAMVPGST